MPPLPAGLDNIFFDTHNPLPPNHGIHAVEPPASAICDNGFSDIHISITPPEPPPPPWPPPPLIWKPLILPPASFDNTILCNILPTYLPTVLYKRSNQHTRLSVSFITNMQ